MLFFTGIVLNFRGESRQGDVKILKEFEKEPPIEHTRKRDISKREAVKLRRRSRIKVTFPDLSDIWSA